MKIEFYCCNIYKHRFGVMVTHQFDSDNLAYSFLLNFFTELCLIVWSSDKPTKKE